MESGPALLTTAGLAMMLAGLRAEPEEGREGVARGARASGGAVAGGVGWRSEPLPGRELERGTIDGVPILLC